MRPDVHDAAYLWDMLDRANIIREFCASLKFHEYLRDKKLQLAVERLIEIIGEAANRVSNEFQQAHPEIPWRKIISQRNVLAHEYGEIKQELIYKVATQRIPELIARLENLSLPPQPSDP